MAGATAPAFCLGLGLAGSTPGGTTESATFESATLGRLMWRFPRPIARPT
jgi:hypothetical protein